MTDGYGTEKHVTEYADGRRVTEITKFRGGEINNRLIHYKVRVKVASSRDEMTEFMRFSDLLREKREAGNLSVDVEDRYTIPAFWVDYPKHNIDGSYFIVKSWCEKV